MKVAVTGATGFLGRYIVRQLTANGHQCRCWYRPTSDRSGLDDIKDSIEWQEGSLSDSDAIKNLVQGMDAVVHAAVDWERSRGTKTTNLVSYLQKNFMGSIALMDNARRAGVPRFVFIATCAVHEVILDDRPLDETHPLWATSHYGAMKGAIEKFVHSFGLGEKWPVCSLRPTGIYGVAYPPTRSRWYDLIGSVVCGDDINTPSGGKEVHVADVAKAVDLLLNAGAEAIAGQAFNCYDMYIAEEHVAEIAKEVSGSKSTIKRLNRGPLHQIETGKLKSLGMVFGGEPLLRESVATLVHHAQKDLH